MGLLRLPADPAFPQLLRIPPRKGLPFLRYLPPLPYTPLWQSRGQHSCKCEVPPAPGGEVLCASSMYPKQGSQGKVGSPGHAACASLPHTKGGPGSASSDFPETANTQGPTSARKPHTHHCPPPRIHLTQQLRHRPLSGCTPGLYS